MPTKGMIVEPLHPSESIELRDALCILLVAGVILVTAQYLLGHWDELLKAAVAWFPLWHWGG